MNSKRHAAFTLVEILVVVTIIGILAALLVPAIYSGLVAAKDARIAIELANLDAAMQTYKRTIHGYAFPPNFNDAAKVKAHIQQKFGRYNPASATAPPTNLDPAEALVFWLQGYGTDPTNPLSDPGNATGDLSLRKALFDFDETRLVKTEVKDGFQCYHYHPKDGQKVPYVYFHHASYGQTYSDSTGTGKAHAYKSALTNHPYVNKNSFQILSAGQDGNWGKDSAEKVFPTGTNYGEGDNDNITNFSEGTLDDQKG